MKKEIKSIPLEDGYTSECTHFDHEKWENILDGFSDANIYQTKSYNCVRSGERNIRNFILTKKEKIVSAAQVRILNVPIFRTRVAYIRWGPLWKLYNEEKDLSNFRMAIRALRNEFVCRRGMILRIKPILYEINDKYYSNILIAEKYKQNEKELRQKTLLVNLQDTKDEIRKNFNGKWRNLLNKAERNKLEIIEGTEDSLFSDFINIYKDMLKRKKFTEPHDINEFREIQKKLAQNYKMRIFLCKSNNKISAGGVFTSIGENGVYLLGATNEIGMKNRGSYLLQWKAIQWMKDCGCKYYNLNGINKELNYGVYHFKKGIVGKSGTEEKYCGTFDSYLGFRNYFIENLAMRKYSLAKKVVKIITRFEKQKKGKL